MLASEADVLRTLRAGTYTLEELYALCERRAPVTRDRGRDPVPDHPGDRRWKRRVRGALQSLRASGHAQRVARSTWAIDGPPERPRRLLLIVAGATPAEFELRLQSAVDLLRTLDEPADLVLTDPPYALGRGHGRFADRRGYRRDADRVLDGYVDVDPAAYDAFTAEWIAAAAQALRAGGQLAVMSGPQRAAPVQLAGERAGLTWVSSIAARREFALYTHRRPSCAHWTITVLCRGALTHPGRVFHPPADQSAARSGRPYPLDWWPDNGRADRPGQLRNDCELPLRLVRRIVAAFSDPGEHVVDPFVGGGSTLAACWLEQRRFTGGDLNPRAVALAAARLLDEHAWPRERQPTLWDHSVA
jgi:methylase of polypeptide subunit release factors